MIYPKTFKAPRLACAGFFFTDDGAMDLETLLRDSTQKLEAAGVYSPREDAERIAGQILSLTPDALKKNPARVLSGDEQGAIESAISRRQKREPIARIFGRADFCGLSIGVVPNVFEPVAESQSLIEHAVEFLKKREGALRVLDLGTGTGCLLLSVLAAEPRATGIGVDVNLDAVKAAQANAQKLGLGARATFYQNDWSDGVEEAFDLIIANPPFIPRRLIKTLVPEVRVHDPLASLEGGGDGLFFYRRLARDFDRLAKPGARGMFQVSYTFTEGAQRLFRRRGYDAQVLRNYYGMPVGVSIVNAGSAAFFQKAMRLVQF